MQTDCEKTIGQSKVSGEMSTRPRERVHRERAVVAGGVVLHEIKNVSSSFA